MSTPNCSRFSWPEARTGVVQLTLTYKNKRATRLTVMNVLIASLLFPRSRVSRPSDVAAPKENVKVAKQSCRPTIRRQ